MVHSLKPEYEGKIRFLEANISTDEGAGFARKHGAGKITLILFRPNGEKITSITDLHSADFFRKAFNLAYNLET